MHFHLYSLNIVSVEIDKSMNGKNVKCWASNKIQNKPYETEEVHTLNVHCKYPIVPGSHVTTSCLLSPAQTPPPSPRSRRTCPRTPARRSRWSARRTATRRPLMRGSGELINWCIRLRSSTLILFLCQILYLVQFHFICIYSQFISINITPCKPAPSLTSPVHPAAPPP